MYNHQLDGFIAAAERGSFSQAAKEMFITPAALIQQMNLLEKRVGVPLFERKRSGVTLTAAGRAFYDDACDLRARAQAALARAREAAKSTRGTVRVGTSLLTKCRMLPALWLQVAEHAPDLRIEIVSLRSPELSLQRPLEDLGTAFDVQDGLLLSESYKDRSGFLFFDDEPIMAALPAHHALCGREALTAADLDGQTVVTLERGTSHHFDVLHDWLEMRTSCRIEHVRFYDMDVFTACEMEGKVLLSPAIWQDIHPALRAHRLEEGFTVPYGLIHATDPSPAVRAFLDAIAEGLAQSQRS